MQANWLKSPGNSFSRFNGEHDKKMRTTTMSNSLQKNLNQPKRESDFLIDYAFIYEEKRDCASL